MSYPKLYPIQEKFIPVNEFSRPSKAVLISKPKRGVVWHYTAGAKEPTAANIDSYFAGLATQDPHDGNDDRYAGAHLEIDRTSRVQAIPWDEGAYHCGAKVYKPGIQDRFGSYPNSATWGVEMCCATTEKLPEETFENAVDLGAWFIIETRPGGELAPYVAHPLTTADYVRHYDVTGKICPKPWVDDPSEWTRFLAAVNQKVKEWDEMEALVKQLQADVAALKDQLAVEDAPAWFVKEFGSASAGGLIDTTKGTADFWRGAAVAIRAAKKIAGK